MALTAHHLCAAFSRFGVVITEAEAVYESEFSPREAILMLLANREIGARFDAAHGRPPEEADIEALLDVCEALAKRA